MLFVVIQEPKQKYRIAYCINLQFVDAKNAAEARHKAEVIADTAFKRPYAVPVDAGTTIRA